MNSISKHVVALLSLGILLGLLPKIHAQNSPKAKQLIGMYERNTAEGWRNPSPGMEVIPALPRYEYLELNWNRTLNMAKGWEDSFRNKPKWKIHKDTLEINYQFLKKKGASKTNMVLRYHVVMEDDLRGACLEPINTSQKIPFCYVNSEAFSSMRNRVGVSTDYYGNGNISSQGKMKKFADGDRKNPIILENGKFKYYDWEGNLVKIVYFKKGETKREKIVKKKTPEKK